MDEADTDSEYELYLDYQRGEGDPSRVFHAMGGMIDVFSALDKDLGAMISASCEPSIVLTDIESGSLRSKLRDMLQDLPDEALEEVNVRQIIGHFLVKAKYAIIRWCEQTDSVEDIDDIRSLEDQIGKLAQDTEIKKFPAYTPVDRKALLHHINDMTNVLSSLEERDSLEYRSAFGNSRFNGNLAISPEVITSVLTQQMVTRRGVHVLKVKKPDYLGVSKWSVRHQGHSVDVKISDSGWLSSFQNGQVALQPGDSIRADLKEEVAYGYQGEIVHTWYEIEKVHEVIPGPGRGQSPLF